MSKKNKNRFKQGIIQLINLYNMDLITHEEYWRHMDRFLDAEKAQDYADAVELVDALYIERCKKAV